jgi:ABC-2 type transport system ATP-binding protein
MPVAEISSLTVKYGQKVAVHELSCTVPEGCVGLLGPNGAGKTTLIKALLGFLRPTAGTGAVLGKDIATDALAIRMSVGLMPEIDCHIPGLTAVEYVAYAGELAGMPRSHAMRRAHEVLDYCALGEARYRNLETYSTGMKQRAKLAQALVHGPKLVFLDEPTNGLDPEGRSEMLELIRDVSHGKGVNVVVSSHLLPDIERTCDFVIVMQGGKVRTQESVSGIKKVSAIQFEVELKEASESFVASVERAGGALISSLSSFYRLEFSDASGSPARLLFQCARESGAQIRLLRPAEKSLEEAFIELIQ